MGIGGHILGDRKLRQLQRLTGLPLDRAYRRNRYAEGRVAEAGECVHYAIDPKTGESERIARPSHWTTCHRPGVEIT